MLALVASAALTLVLTCCREQPSAPPPVPSTTALALALATATAPPTARAPRITYDTSCKKDWECTPAPACCVAPCSSNVINTREVERARADLHCDPAEHCPVAGGCQTYAYLCVDNACKIVFANEQAFRKREIQP